MLSSAKYDLDRAHLARLRKMGVEVRRFFDIGGSDGEWSWHISQDFPQATFDLFEPLADQVAEYSDTLKKTLQNPRFRVHKIALGSECKRSSMSVYPDNPRGSTALESAAVTDEAKNVEVQMLTLDRAVDQFRLPLPHVIKIDTQGCELNILAGARETLPGVSALVLECWLMRSYGPKTPLLLEVANFLRQFDFYLWDFGGEWRDDKGVLGAQDCVFLNARAPGSRLLPELRRR
jgi:FkbM family methyltransferase